MSMDVNADIRKAIKDAKCNQNTFTENERYLVSKIFQAYYGQGIYDIAEENEIAKSLFIKIGLIKEKEN